MTVETGRALIAFINILFIDRYHSLVRYARMYRVYNYLSICIPENSSMNYEVKIS